MFEVEVESDGFDGDISVMGKGRVEEMEEWRGRGRRPSRGSIGFIIRYVY